MHPPALVSASKPQPAPSVSVVIPARFASTRLPGKPLLDIGGRPMIEHVYRRAAQARGVSEVVVATDDERIAEVVRAFGGLAVLTSPHHASGTDRVAEVARGLTSDLIVNAQGDEPALSPVSIETAIGPLAADASVVMGTLGFRLDEATDPANPNVVKVLVGHDGFAIYFSRAPIPFRRDPAALARSVFKHLGLYVYRRAFLLTLASLPRMPLEQSESLEQLRAIEHGYRIKVVETPVDSISVDTPDDLERARRLAADGLLA